MFHLKRAIIKTIVKVIEDLKFSIKNLLSYKNE